MNTEQLTQLMEFVNHQLQEKQEEEKGGPVPRITTEQIRKATELENDAPTGIYVMVNCTDPIVAGFTSKKRECTMQDLDKAQSAIASYELQMARMKRDRLFVTWRDLTSDYGKKCTRCGFLNTRELFTTVFRSSKPACRNCSGSLLDSHCKEYFDIRFKRKMAGYDLARACAGLALGDLERQYGLVVTARMPIPKYAPSDVEGETFWDTFRFYNDY